MANPTVSASLNKPAYQPGETMTLTVTYGDFDTKVISLNVTATDSQGNTGSTGPVNAIIDPVTLAVTDPDHVWAKQSDNGAVAVYTSVA